MGTVVPNTDRVWRAPVEVSRAKWLGRRSAQCGATRRLRHVAWVTRWGFLLSTRTHATTDQFQDGGRHAGSPAGQLRTLRPRSGKGRLFQRRNIFERRAGLLGRNAQRHMTKRKFYRRGI